MESEATYDLISILRNVLDLVARNRELKDDSTAVCEFKLAVSRLMAKLQAAASERGLKDNAHHERSSPR